MGGGTSTRRCSRPRQRPWPAWDGLDLTVELITHRFTANSKRILTGWYPSSQLEMDEEVRTMKHTRFRGEKYVYPAAVMAELKAFFAARVPELLPSARILYFT